MQKRKREKEKKGKEKNKEREQARRKITSNYYLIERLKKNNAKEKEMGKTEMVYESDVLTHRPFVTRATVKVDEEVGDNVPR